MIEVVVSIGVLGVVIVPIMSLFVMSAKINSESDIEYKSSLAAQRYMEEIKAMEAIDTEIYTYNSSSRLYKRIIVQTEHDFGVEIYIIPESNLLLKIEVKILHDGEVVNVLNGSKIVKK